jgi:large subunit ribosomal protein L24
MERKYNTQPKLHIKKNDMVKVIAGASKGKTGRVLRVLPKTLRAIVEGINLVSRHTKPTTKTPNGGIVKKEAPIHLSNLMLLDAQGNATRTGRKMNDREQLQRFSKKSGEFIN